MAAVPRPLRSPKVFDHTKRVHLNKKAIGKQSSSIIERKQCMV